MLQRLARTCHRRRWRVLALWALLGAGIGTIMPPARRAIVLTSAGNQGERLGILYAAYLSGFVFGPPLAGADGGGRRAPAVPRARRRGRRGLPLARRAGPARGAPGGGPRGRAGRQAGAPPAGFDPPSDGRRPGGRLVPLLHRRVRAAVGHSPRRPRGVDHDGLAVPHRVRPAHAGGGQAGGAALRPLRPPPGVGGDRPPWPRRRSWPCTASWAPSRSSSPWLCRRRGPDAR